MLGIGVAVGVGERGASKAFVTAEEGQEVGAVEAAAVAGKVVRAGVRRHHDGEEVSSSSSRALLLLLLFWRWDSVGEEV